VRCLGELSAPRLTKLREADAIVLEELRLAGLYRQIQQAFAVLLPVQSVGVMGDGRTYEEVIAVRAVSTDDFMTADWYPMPHDVLQRISTRIINEVRGVNRVVYDISSKPPARSNGSDGSPMAERILSISGLRGVVGDGLDPEYVTRFAASLGTVVNGGTVVLARDGRSTGEMLRHAVLSDWWRPDARCSIWELHRRDMRCHGDSPGAAGGLQLTASHNPIEWNGLKPFSPRGSVFDKAAGERLLSVINGSPAYRTWSELGSVERLPIRIANISVACSSWSMLPHSPPGNSGGPRLQSWFR